jgi:hypothetical protein
MSRVKTFAPTAAPEVDLRQITDEALRAVWGGGSFTSPWRRYRELCRAGDAVAVERFKREFRAARAAWAEWEARQRFAGLNPGLPPWERQKHKRTPRLINSVFDLIPEVIETGIRAARTAQERAARAFYRQAKAAEGRLERQ